jgi:AcrR family transcriptional regulator
MPRPRWDKLDSATRDRILDVAAAEFLNHGYNEASFNHIIQEAGLSKGTAYYYFDDKLDLFTTVMRRSVREMLAAVGDLGPCHSVETYWIEVRNLLERGGRFKTARPDLVSLSLVVLRAMASGVEGVSIDLLLGEFFSLYESFIRKGQELGAVRRDLPAAALVSLMFGASQGLDLWFVRNVKVVEVLQEIDFDAALEFSMGLFRRILEPGIEQPFFSFAAGDAAAVTRGKAQ